MPAPSQHGASADSMTDSAIMQPRTSLVDILTIYTPVQDHILHHLPIKDVISLSHVTKSLSKMYPIVTQAQMNINSQLRTYFNDPIAFHNLQATCNIIISGAFVLRYLSRGQIGYKNPGKNSGKNSFLLLFVKQGRDSNRLSAFLEKNHYAHDEAEPTPPLVWSGNPVATYRCFRPVELSSYSEDILVATTKTTPLYCICMSMLTTQCNFITWKKAYSLFLRTTFIDHESFILTNRQWGDVAARTGYLNAARTLGFAVQNVEGISPSSIPSYITDYAEFQLIPNPGTTPFASYLFKTKLVECEALKYAYLCLPKPGRALPKQLEIHAKRYRDLTLIGAMSLDLNDSPSDTQLQANTVQTLDNTYVWPMFEGWEPPSSWKYYDDEVLEILKQKWPELRA
ncbi:hypothetical protein K491DRAFT_710488 [Lophiostoma macrostomum CBS 122681]|uniref:F-box domain-containing protein n=1 Tax=Lophiostoma macrostomum CBS 122681 TaxID=1314788 RepID=A0A6A6TPR8_9PLEO|nr:hypothetical protein K491DRAFT_710488 [Lophiostoma macrostomum CBS 122681]